MQEKKVLKKDKKIVKRPKPRVETQIVLIAQAPTFTI
jgi:hypothetical protein